MHSYKEIKIKFKEHSKYEYNLPEHLMHIKQPKVIDAHLGILLGQSIQN